MRRFRERFDVAALHADPAAARRAAGELPRLGRHRQPAAIAIVDWREVPTWSEFELLRDAFIGAGVPTVICDPRDLVLRRIALVAGGVPVDLVYRRVLINDIVARADECRALIDAYRAAAVCVANTLPLQDRAQEGVLRRADRRAVPHRSSATASAR